MKVYLVGGAVRDALLGLPVKEHDWVVVGGSATELLAEGYKQVGRDFPVFLHPDTQEEYALARTERKKGAGYYGFDCDAHPNVTLEEDLLRRDLTINAMAQDEDGRIIDPYGGQEDLTNRILRHVSPAFVEDPVRVLRLARFAARFHHLGFRIADETRRLMYEMVLNSELNHLVPERIWQEFHAALTEKNPEQFILILRSCAALKVILPEIDALFGVPNPTKYHPEIDSGIHSLMVLEVATSLSQAAALRFAALTHDLGKAKSPMTHWPKHHGHEESGVPLVEHLCERLRIPKDFRDLAVLVTRHHLTIHRLFEMKAATIVTLLEKVDAFRRPERFKQLIIACEADALGIGQDRDYPQTKAWEYLFTECAKIKSSDLVNKGFTGPAIKEELHRERVACVNLILESGLLNEK